MEIFSPWYSTFLNTFSNWVGIQFGLSLIPKSSSYGNQYNLIFSLSTYQAKKSNWNIHLTDSLVDIGNLTSCKLLSIIDKWDFISSYILLFIIIFIKRNKIFKSQ